MNKKLYEKPAIQAVKIQHQAHLLQDSDVESTRSGYGTANSEVDADELDSEGTWIWD